MFLLKYTPDLAKKYSLKGRPDYEAVTQWLIMRKNNVYAGRLALIRLGCNMEIRLTMLDKSPFTYKKVLRFVERMYIKKGLKETKVSVSFSGKALKASKPTEAMRQAMLCLANGYSLSNKCLETVFYPRESFEASKWFDRRFKAYKGQSSFAPVEGYTVRLYSELKKEELASMQATVKQHFVPYIGFNADFQGFDANTSYVVLKNEVLVAFLSMSHDKNGQYVMEGISSHRGHPRAGMVALSRFAYDLQKNMPDFKSLRADFLNLCDSGRRLVVDVLKLPIASYERRVYFRKKLCGHKSRHLLKQLNQQELHKQIIDMPHTISMSCI